MLRIMGEYDTQRSTLQDKVKFPGQTEEVFREVWKQALKGGL